VSRPLRVLLGVCGGIAAYKSAEIVRRLRERGHEVRCALTPSAGAFVSELTLEVLSGHKVHREEYLTPTASGEELHISAAAWAEVFCLAPVTAHTLAGLALGLGENFLTTTALAFRGPLVLAPAMHAAMWEKRSVQAHVARLRGDGARFVGPIVGALASGEIGMGRMADPAAIVAAVEETLAPGDLAGRTVLITAGPTHEPIDPVRYLGNRSSGKMGFALAEEAARRGARTVLVSGPVSLPTPRGVERQDVATALEMEEAVIRHAPHSDLVIMAAAVADFRPTRAAAEKIKKSAGVPDIRLVRNPDILAALPSLAPQALRIGFAAETQGLAEEAERKLRDKGAHLLVANDVSRADIGFGSEANEVTVYRLHEPPVFLSRRPKDELARELFDLFVAELARTREASGVPS
jgi:phosphopantothenoylcysteine decarboxylase/phosphopantothenate--cysteine ligase